jgi:hypothetical protein
MKLTSLDDIFTSRTAENLKVLPQRITPNFFCDKVKRIVNNSNYGVVTKVQKLAPIVKG